jgi:hypothetical protein
MRTIACVLVIAISCSFIAEGVGDICRDKEDDVGGKSFVFKKINFK